MPQFLTVQFSSRPPKTTFTGRGDFHFAALLATPLSRNAARSAGGFADFTRAACEAQGRATGPGITRPLQGLGRRVSRFGRIHCRTWLAAVQPEPVGS